MPLNHLMPRYRPPRSPLLPRPAACRRRHPRRASRLSPSSVRSLSLLNPGGAMSASRTSSGASGTTSYVGTGCIQLAPSVFAWSVICAPSWASVPVSKQSSCVRPGSPFWPNRLSRIPAFPPTAVNVGGSRPLCARSAPSPAPGALVPARAADPAPLSASPAFARAAAPVLLPRRGSRLGSTLCPSSFARPLLQHSAPSLRPVSLAPLPSSVPPQPARRVKTNLGRPCPSAR
jgi:hypothetical protein